MEPDEAIEGPKQPGILLRMVRDQRIAFLIVGGMNTVVGFGLFVLFDVTVGRALDLTAGSVVGSLVTLAMAHVTSVLFAFVMYRRFVFRVSGNVWHDLARFESVYLVSLGVNALVLPVLVQAGVQRILAQAAIILATTAISYLGHRHFSFRRKPTGADVPPAGPNVTS